MRGHMLTISMRGIQLLFRYLTSLGSFDTVIPSSFFVIGRKWSKENVFPRLIWPLLQTLIDM